MTARYVAVGLIHIGGATVKVATRLELPSAAGQGAWPGDSDTPVVTVVGMVVVVLVVVVVFVAVVVGVVVVAGALVAGDVVVGAVVVTAIVVVAAVVVGAIVEVASAAETVVVVSSAVVSSAVAVVCGSADASGLVVEAPSAVSTEDDALDTVASAGAATLIVSSVWPNNCEKSAAPMRTMPVTSAVPIAVRLADWRGEGSGSKVMRTR